MKTMFLLLAVWPAAPAALYAQPNYYNSQQRRTNEYKSLEKATQRAYSVPDRPASNNSPSNTALRDVAELQRRFPAEAAQLAADQLHINVAVLGALSTDELQCSRMHEAFATALKKVQQQLPQQEALIALDLLAVARGAAKILHAFEPRDDAERKNVAAMARLLHTTCKAALANTPNDKRLTDGPGTSADVLLAAAEHDQRRDPAHLEWLKAAGKSAGYTAASKCAGELMRAVVEDPTLLLQPDGQEAKELEILVWQGQAVDLPRLAWL